MEIEFDKMSINEIIDNIVYTWSVEYIFYFLGFVHEKNFHVDTENKWGQTALEILALDKTNFEPYTVRKRLVVKLLLKYGADPFKICFTGETLLWNVASSGDTNLMKIFLHYVNINYPLEIYYQLTPLHVAVDKGYTDVVAYILERNPNIEAKSLNGSTPLHIAATMENTEVTKMLIKHGADLEAGNFSGRTALFYAVRFNRIEQARLLIKYGANIKARDNAGKSLLTVAAMLDSSLELFELLLSIGCDPNTQDIEGKSALHYIVSSYNPHKSRKLLQLMLGHGASLTKRDNNGDTVLHTLARFCVQPPESLIFLIKGGADMSILNNANETFIDVLMNDDPQRGLLIMQYLYLGYAGNKLEFKKDQLDAIRSTEVLVEFEKACCKELYNLKRRKVGKNLSFSLFSVLNGSERQVSKFCANEKLRSAMAEFNSKEFPIYAKMLKNKYTNGLKRYETETAGCNLLRYITNGGLHLNTSELILKFTPSEDLARIEEYLASRNLFRRPQD